MTIPALWHTFRFILNLGLLYTWEFKDNGGGRYSGGGSGRRMQQAGGGGGSYCGGMSCSGTTGGNPEDQGREQIIRLLD